MRSEVGLDDVGGVFQADGFCNSEMKAPEARPGSTGVAMAAVARREGGACALPQRLGGAGRGERDAQSGPRSDWAGPGGAGVTRGADRAAIGRCCWARWRARGALGGRRRAQRRYKMAVEPPREAVWPEGAGAEAGFVRAVLSLPEKPDTTVRFFERGDYYTVHGADARLAARELFRTRAVIRQLAGAPGACGRAGGRGSPGSSAEGRRAGAAGGAPVLRAWLRRVSGGRGRRGRERAVVAAAPGCPR